MIVWSIVTICRARFSVVLLRSLRNRSAFLRALFAHSIELSTTDEEQRKFQYLNWFSVFSRRQTSFLLKNRKTFLANFPLVIRVDNYFEKRSKKLPKTEFSGNSMRVTDTSAGMCAWFSEILGLWEKVQEKKSTVLGGTKTVLPTEKSQIWSLLSTALLDHKWPVMNYERTTSPTAWGGSSNYYYKNPYSYAYSFSKTP